MKSITFWCTPTADEWAPPRLNDGGIGGSETAVIHIASLFHKAGWRVDVFNHAGRYEGEHDGVGYWENQRCKDWGWKTDVLVVWRQPDAHDIPIKAERRLLWLHDHNYGPGAGEALRSSAWDRVLGVSRYHADFLKEAYDLSPERTKFVPNGIDLSRFDSAIPKVLGRCVYASSPDRGLVTLLKLWPKIIEGHDNAELHIAYGWHNFDMWISAGRHDMAHFKTEAEALIKATPRVVWRDRLAQDELARLYSESVAWLYPTDFLETNCISAQEAMAAGCIPVCSSCGNLKHVVADAGVVVWGPGKTRSNPYSPAWRDFYVSVAQGVIFEMNARKFIEKRCREWAQQFSWERAFEDHWLPLVYEVMS